MVNSKQIFDYLPGIWKLSRKTLTPLKNWQNSGAECIVANGYAAFISSKIDSNLLIYSEKVTVYNLNSNESNTVSSSANGATVAKQQYKYQYDKNTQNIVKYFSDDRLFYNLNINPEVEKCSDGTNNTVASGSNVFQACGEHLCIQDNYIANYEFSDLDSDNKKFILKYSINGPKKCYEIINEYEKINSPNLEELDIQIENETIL